MNLLYNSLLHAMSDLVTKKEIKGARVSSKVNSKGELVMAIIIPPSRPGEWGPPETRRTSSR